MVLGNRRAVFSSFPKVLILRTKAGRKRLAETEKKGSGIGARAGTGISLAKDPTICSCKYRSCEYHLRWSSLWGHETLEGCAETETCGEQRQGGTGGRRGRRRMPTRGTFFLPKRRPNTTGWFGITRRGDPQYVYVVSWNFPLRMSARMSGHKLA